MRTISNINLILTARIDPNHANSQIMLKKLLIISGPILVGFLVYFFYQFRGSLPAILPAASPKIEINTVQEIPNSLGLKLPPGFAIDIFAENLKAPRDLLFDQDGILLASIPQDGKVVALPDKDNNGKVDKTINLIENLDKPHGLAQKDGNLFVAELKKVTRYDYSSQSLQATDPVKVVDLPEGGRHNTRSLEFAKNGQLLISVGSTCDVCVELDPRHGTILSAGFNSTKTEVYAHGLRNSVFLTPHPETGQIWATEMGRDFLGDNLPPDELNIIEQDKNYGWPYCYGTQVPDSKFANIRPEHNPCTNTQKPIYEIPAHSAPLGLAFITSDQFPQDFKNDLLIAYHGSWNRSTPTGYKIVRVKLDEGNTSEVDFIAGFLQGNRTSGRPADLIFSKNGQLFISDDKAGVIYRVWYAN